MSKPDYDNEKAILDAWEANAKPWISAVRSSAIGTRVRATDDAILGAIRALSPASVLDVGCGEGWLTRTLANEGMRVLGVDAVGSLVDAARTAGGGEYLCLTYDEISDGKLEIEVDAVVCNFSLFGGESVERLIATFPSLLRPAGALIIQTVHPETADGVLPHEAGWREGSWSGCGPGFSDPAPWFLRSKDDWIDVLTSQGFTRVEVTAPIDPASGAPASLLLTGRIR
ncbi:MAG: class I SAM-dependent methyltransferase [Rhodothermia bacterium]|nr:class I SAM-dependent methyltransferase [Rhodothermia bacterium]